MRNAWQYRSENHPLQNERGRGGEVGDSVFAEVEGSEEEGSGEGGFGEAGFGGGGERGRGAKVFLTRFTKFGERGFLLESVGGEWREGGGVPVSRLDRLFKGSGGEILMGLLRFEDRGFL